MNAAAWTEEGNALFRQGAYEDAIAAYNAAIQLEPSYGVPYGNLALTFLSQGQCAEAIPLYEKSIELLGVGPGQGALVERARQCLSRRWRLCARGGRVSARGGTRSRDERHPRLGRGCSVRRTAQEGATLIKLGTVLLKTGSADEAVSAFQKAIELEPEAGAAYSNLARALASQGKYGEAVALFEKSIDLLDDDKDKAQALERSGQRAPQAPGLRKRHPFVSQSSRAGP